jgi:predicted aconitase with swiveling domain
MSMVFHQTRINGTAPKALIFNDMTTKAALASVILHAPAITGLDQNPIDVIKSGDWVKVDADNGAVEITTKES